MLKKIILLSIIFLSTNLVAQTKVSEGIATNTKVAHINTYELITSMPEMVEVKKQLDQFYNDRQNEIREMESALRIKIELYQSEVPEKTDQENKERLVKISPIISNIKVTNNFNFKDITYVNDKYSHNIPLWVIIYLEKLELTM